MVINEYVKFNQNNINMYIMSLLVKDIINNYEVDIYDEHVNPEGYQRPPIPTHYKDIAKHLLTSSKSIFLPSAIIGAVDKNQLKVSNENKIEIQGKIRIVDGQHRIKGFEYAIEKEGKIGLPYEDSNIQNLKEFQLPVILIVIDNLNPREKLNEVIAFIDINSKGKKVNTDLAISLRNEMYKTNEDYLLEESKLVEKIATETSKHLNKSEGTLWYESIKFSPTDNNRIISVNLFNKSLAPIIKHLIELTNPNDSKEVENIIKELYKFISKSWVLIYDRWTGCFINYHTFNKNFNIQKGIGVYALHLVLDESIATIKKQHTDFDSPSLLHDILSKALKDFQEKLSQSSIIEEDWSKGGKFSGYNSASGFKKVKYYVIHNEFPV